MLSLQENGCHMTSGNKGKGPGRPDVDEETCPQSSLWCEFLATFLIFVLPAYLYCGLFSDFRVCYNNCIMNLRFIGQNSVGDSLWNKCSHVNCSHELLLINELLLAFLVCSLCMGWM